jgi:hypothetical protein
MACHATSYIRMGGKGLVRAAGCDMLCDCVSARTRSRIRIAETRIIFHTSRYSKSHSTFAALEILLFH